jgi:CRISPR-associated protein Cas1
MLHQVVEIREENRYISLDRGFLSVNHGEEEIAKLPIDDIAVLLISAQSVSFSKHIANELAEHGAITLLCGRNYQPQSIIIPVVGHYMQTGIIKAQIQSTLPLRKNIWKLIVETKLKNQGKALILYNKKEDASLLFKISNIVKSGDPENREAYGARMYWKSLFGEKFIRDKDGEGINAFLNYGYAVVRASMTRAICAAGLLPSLGVHHNNKLNPFCLSDDLFEPFRPLVDCVVYSVTQGNTHPELSPEMKKLLIRVLWIKLQTTEGNSPLFQSLHYFAASYVKALTSKKLVLKIPYWEGKHEILPDTEQV